MNDSQERSASYNPGDTVELKVLRMAHGGEGVAELSGDGRVFFVAGAYPGDTVKAQITKLKKSFGRATTTEVVTAGELRVDSTCPAAANGAGCCDFATLDPDKELELKSTVLMDQVARLAGLDDLPTPTLIELSPRRHWRTRVRLGVDSKGRAGLRMKGSHELVTSAVCTQLVEGLVEGIVGSGAQTRRFTPGAEVIVVMDSDNRRHVIETSKAPRGRRVEKVVKVLEGEKDVIERADGHTFKFPATAFWQAHAQAPDTYTELVRAWLRPYTEPGQDINAWDLYSGVGVFIPAISEALSTTGSKVTVYSVDYSPAATAKEQSSLKGYDVKVITDRVEKVAAQLPGPAAVVLDPPRTGAGEQVVNTVAAAAPEQVIHVGCDPATFARDLKYWSKAGYRAKKLAIINAFPGTHHLEAVVLLEQVEA